MAIESLPEDIQKEIEKELRDNKNTVRGCKIFIKDNQVNIQIPIENNITEYKTYVFSKRDVKSLFEGLYTS